MRSLILFLYIILPSTISFLPPLSPLPSSSPLLQNLLSQNPQSSLTTLPTATSLPLLLPPPKLNPGHNPKHAPKFITRLHAKQPNIETEITQETIEYKRAFMRTAQTGESKDSIIIMKNGKDTTMASKEITLSTLFLFF